MSRHIHVHMHTSDVGGESWVGGKKTGYSINTASDTRRHTFMKPLISRKGLDAQTPEGAKKAAATRKAHGGGGSIPGGSAAKTRNHLTNNYGLHPWKGSSESNPYSNIQSLSGIMPNHHAERLKKDLASSGWKENSRHLQKGHVNYDHPTEENSSIRLSPRSDKTHHHVEVLGPKKAKRTTLPYYDSGTSEGARKASHLKKHF